MALAAERALRQAIRENTFERVYYFFGDDDYLKDGTAREMLAVATETATREFNCDVLRGGETSAETLDTVLHTPPMLATQRAVMVRDVHALSKESRAVLTRYLSRPAPGVLLLLISPAGEKADQTLVGESCAVEFAPLSPDRVTRWIVHHAQAALGIEVTAAAAVLLQDSAGTDLAQLAAELDKLASYAPGGPITEDTVAAVVGVRQGESLSDLLDAVAARDGSRSAALVPNVLAQPKVTVVTVIMALTTQLLAMGWGNAARERNARPGTLERDYFALLRESRAYPGRSWGNAVACWSRSTARWTGAAIDEGLSMLLAADHAAKETRLSSDEQLLTVLVLGLCAAGESVAA
jgi:DNA polymerase III subunit delta